VILAPADKANGGFTGILVPAEEIYVHCGKALIRYDPVELGKASAALRVPVFGHRPHRADRRDPETLERYKTRLY
jgi:hypothetical protein